MTRRRIPPKERIEIFTRENGICHLCEGKITVGEAWDISHEIALELGGGDEGSNLRVAHRKCHRCHTSENDAPTIAKVKRIRKRHLGIKKPRTMTSWRKFDGTIVRKSRER